MSLYYRPMLLSHQLFCETVPLITTLKGQSHKKVGVLRVEGDSLGPN
jgi:hypothetical protein